jgi:hypothetical protein
MQIHQEERLAQVQQLSMLAIDMKQGLQLGDAEDELNMLSRWNELRTVYTKHNFIPLLPRFDFDARDFWT